MKAAATENTELKWTRKVEVSEGMAKERKRKKGERKAKTMVVELKKKKCKRKETRGSSKDERESNKTDNSWETNFIT